GRTVLLLVCSLSVLYRGICGGGGRVGRSARALAGTAALALVIWLGAAPAQAQFVCDSADADESGAGATAAGGENFACGPDADASGGTSANVATGTLADASGNQSTNVASGVSADASGFRSSNTATGAHADASGDLSTN